MSAGAIRAGRAFVELFADDSKLVSGLKAASAKLKAWGGAITALGAKIFAAGSGIVVPMLGAAKAFSEVGDNIAKASKRTGIAVEEISALMFAADQSAVSFQELEDGIKFMQKALTAAGRAGTHASGELSQLDQIVGELDPSRAAGALARIGVAAKQLQGLSPDEQFKRIADGISRLEDATLRTSVAMAIFGRSGTSLIPMLSEGANGINAMIEKARQLGLVMSANDAKAAEELNDAFGQLWMQMKFVTVAIGSAIAPLLVELIGFVQPLIKGVIEWAKANKPLVKTLFLVGAGLAAAGAAIVAIGSTITFAGMALAQTIFLLGALKAAAIAAWGGAVTIVGFYARLVMRILTPQGLVLKGLDSIVTRSFLASGTLQAVGKGIVNAFGAGKEAIGGIIDALGAGDLEGAFAIGVAGLEAIWAEFVAGLKVAWLRFTTWFLDIWDKVKGIVLFGPLGTIIENWDNLVRNLTDIWTVFLDFWENDTSGAVQFVKQLWAGIWFPFSTVVNVLKQAWSGLAHHFEDGGLGMEGLLLDVWMHIQLAWIQATQKMRTVWSTMLALMKKGWVEFGAFFAKGISQMVEEARSNKVLQFLVPGLTAALGAIPVPEPGEIDRQKQKRLGDIDREAAEQEKRIGQEAGERGRGVMGDNADAKFKAKLRQHEEDLKRRVALATGEKRAADDANAARENLRAVIDEQARRRQAQAAGVAAKVPAPVAGLAGAAAGAPGGGSTGTFSAAVAGRLAAGQSEMARTEELLAAVDRRVEHMAGLVRAAVELIRL